MACPMGIASISSKTSLTGTENSFRSFTTPSLPIKTIPLKTLWIFKFLRSYIPSIWASFPLEKATEPILAEKRIRSRSVVPDTYFLNSSSCPCSLSLFFSLSMSGGTRFFHWSSFNDRVCPKKPARRKRTGHI